MATTTTNFGWDIPQSTDLVKDGATAIAALGQDIDTALVDLKGGTTGQILSKASNTDLDYTWITNDVGDITAVTAGTGITGGGTSGAVTVSFDQANFGGGQYAGAKNRVLNSNFSVWQRGTSFSIALNTITYTSDRWSFYRNATGATITRQATNDTSNLPFIQYCMRVARDSGNTSTQQLQLAQSFETVNSISLAGKSIVLSFYARAGANYSATSSALTVQLIGGTGTDQSAFAYTGLTAPINTTATLTTTWQRFTFTGTIASTVTEIAPRFFFDPTGTAGANDYYEITGVQLEAGSTATPYAPNGATQQAELAACQRYLPAFITSASGTLVGGYAYATNNAIYMLPLPVNARVAPTGITLTGTFEAFGLNTAYTATPAFNGGTVTTGTVTVTSGLTIVAGQGSRLSTNGAATILFTGCEL
jgi:hypothetical protein